MARNRGSTSRRTTPTRWRLSTRWRIVSSTGTAYVVGPYVKQGAIVSTRYSQVNALRTIEDRLGTEHINLNTAFQRPMADVFDLKASGKWTFAAEGSTVLATTTVAQAIGGRGVRYAAGPMITPQHDAAYWDAVTAGEGLH